MQNQRAVLVKTCFTYASGNFFMKRKTCTWTEGEKKTTEMRKSGFILVKTIEAKAEDHESYIYCNEK